MWSSRLPLSRIVCSSIALFGFAVLSACTVEPLNSSGSTTLSGPGGTASVSAILASTEVGPVKTRPAQQVRNALLFAMNGGELRPGGNYRIDLFVTSTTTDLSVQTSSLSPTSARVQMDAKFNIVDTKTGQTLKSGIRRAFASYDRTSQSFANERAERDAQNRAAKEVAQQIRLSVAQTIANQ